MSTNCGEHRNRLTHCTHWAFWIRINPWSVISVSSCTSNLVTWRCTLHRFNLSLGKTWFNYVYNCRQPAGIALFHGREIKAAVAADSTTTAPATNLKSIYKAPVSGAESEALNTITIGLCLTGLIRPYFPEITSRSDLIFEHCWCEIFTASHPTNSVKALKKKLSARMWSNNSYKLQSNNWWNCSQCTGAQSFGDMLLPVSANDHHRIWLKLTYFFRLFRFFLQQIAHILQPPQCVKYQLQNCT